MKLFKKHQINELPTEAVIETDVREFEQSAERLNYLAAEEERQAERFREAMKDADEREMWG